MVRGKGLASNNSSSKSKSPSPEKFDNSTTSNGAYGSHAKKGGSSPNMGRTARKSPSPRLSDLSISNGSGDGNNGGSSNAGRTPAIRFLFFDTIHGVFFTTTNFIF